MTFYVTEFSNREDLEGTIQVTDADTGEPVDTTLATALNLEIDDPHTGTPILQGSLSDGVVTAQDPANGLYTFFWPASQTVKLVQARYRFGAIIKWENDTPPRTKQLFRERINAYDGIVENRNG